jgi:hypothetical protein
MAMRAACMFFAGVALLASCAAPPAAPQPQPADEVQPTAAPSAQAAAPTAAEPQRADEPQAAGAPPAQVEAAPRPAAQPSPGAAVEPGEPPAPALTTGAHAPRAQQQPTAEVERAESKPPDNTQARAGAAKQSAEPSGNADAGQQRPAALVVQDRPHSASPKAQEQAKPAEKKVPAADESAGCGPSREPEPKPSPEGPQPRWVCKQPKITADPVWSGGQVDFVFEIANEGEGDLKIKLKKP